MTRPRPGAGCLPRRASGSSAPLVHHDELRGRIARRERPPDPGTQGLVLDALVVALGPAGVVIAPATTAIAWLCTRRREVRIKVTFADSRSAELTARNVSNLDAAAPARVPWQSRTCCGDDAPMFYEDLTGYEYQVEEEFTDRESGFYGLTFRPAYTRLNIGWLEAGRPYTAGPVPAAFTEKLKGIQAVQWMNVCLGVHECDLCAPGYACEGNGEVRIPGTPGTAYAAPFLISHYITAHGYQPPQVFVDAVLAVDLDAWAAARWPEVPFPWVPDDAERME
ncbi:hypothetical protein OIE14_29575 [Micromonospora peucetia]|uniref:DUF7919 domain-containing protein n=1 Tax=Micromonospora peucetia TaxID=47871 RepID=A0ABZ1ENN1_9ACTN|nr:hypothetical protein OIE14_29575 [Micromonospora peucetia]